MISGTYGRMNSSTGWDLLQRLARVAERRAGDALQARAACASRRRRSLSGPLRRDELAQVVDRRPRAADERAQLAQERREVLRRGLGLGDERVEVVERRAQVDERRVGAPQRASAAAPSACASATFSLADRAPPSCSCCRRATARSSRRSATAVTAREELTMKSVSAASSCVSWLTSCREVDRNGLKYSADCAGLLALAVVLRGEALDDALQVLARLRVERVEELVEVDDVGRRAGRERRAVVELLGRVGRRRQRDVAVGDARQRREADDRGACPRAAARRAPGPPRARARGCRRSA